MAGEPSVVVGSAVSTSLSTTTTPIVNMPASIVAGELIVVVFQLGQANNVTPITNLQGFTQRAHIFTAGNAQALIIDKVATASEPASYTFTWAATALTQAAAFRVSSAAGTPIFDTASASIDTASPFTHPGLTTLSAGCLVLWGAGGNSNATYTWSNTTLDTNEFSESGGGTNRSLAVAYSVQAAAGATGTSNVTPSVAPGTGSLGLSAASYYSPGGDVTPPAAPTGLTATAMLQS